jgi:cytochrome c553
MVGSAAAQDPEPDLHAGAELAATCAACHGAEGVSTGDQYPNLAAQKSTYLAAQLRAFRSGDRQNPLMNAVAADLTDSDIGNLAGHFASLPGAEPGLETANLSGLDGSRPAFPADYADSFTEYHRIDFEDRKQVRAYFANELARTGAAADGPYPQGSFLLVEIHSAQQDGEGNLARGDDGRLLAGDVTGYTAMEKQAGWGDEIPEILRNGDWRYATFDVDGVRNDSLNEAPCLACHVPLTDTDYTFLHDELRTYTGAD